MKSLKKALLLVFSVVMMLTMMTVTASAAKGSVTPTKLTKKMVTIKGTLTYNGKGQSPAKKNIVVKDGKKKLVNGVDYKVEVKKQKNSGTYTLTIKGMGAYKGNVDATYTIKPSAKKNTTVTTKKATVKLSKVKKKKQTVQLKNQVTVKKNKGAVTYALKSVPKGVKKSAVKLDKTTGKLTLPKGAKKGNYVVTVKVAAYNEYKSATKTVTVSVK